MHLQTQTRNFIKKKLYLSLYKTAKLLQLLYFLQNEELCNADWLNEDG